jgi:hypothetical protein
MNESTHWRRFTIFIRLLGVLAMAVGVVMAVGGLDHLLRGGAGSSDGTPVSRADAIAIAFAGLFGAVVGMALLRARPYRPDLGDHAFGQPSAEQVHQRRNWWTGDLKANHDDPAT